MARYSDSAQPMFNILKASIKKRKVIKTAPCDITSQGAVAYAVEFVDVVVIRILIASSALITEKSTVLLKIMPTAEVNAHIFQ